MGWFFIFEVKGGEWLVKKKDINIQCTCCGKEQPKKNFYQSQSYLYKHNKILPVCKSCVEDIFDKYKKRYDDNKLIIYNLCRLFDMPYTEAAFNGAYQHSSKTGWKIYQSYFKQVNSFGDVNNYGINFNDSDSFMKENDSITNDAVDQEEEYDMDITKLSQEKKKKLEDKWGLGYSDTELLLFEKKHKMFRNNYKEKTAMHREALFNYIRYRVKEEMATAEGNVKEAKEWGALASKAATDAKINPSQLSKADLSDGLSTFSELSEAVEKEVDIISILPKFKYRPNDAIDFNIWCYINYMRDLSGLPLCDYEDIYKFYDKRKEDYINQYGDPYGIFEGDTTEKNRDNIKKFIREDDI